MTTRYRGRIRCFRWQSMWLVLSFIMTVVGLYGTFHIRSPKVTMDIVGRSNVLDVHKSLSDLIILFRGNDIEKEQLNLSILTLRVENAGEANVLQSYYDQGSPWGFLVDEARIVEVRLLDANSDYLLSSVKPTASTENSVVFEKVILERGAYFTVEVLLLHDRKAEPKIRPVGKIAGVDEIRIRDFWSSQTKPSFVTQVFSGNLVVNSVRAVFYLFALLIALIIAVGLQEKLTWRLRERRGWAVLKEFNLTDDVKRVIVNLYAAGGIHALRMLVTTLSSECSFRWYRDNPDLEVGIVPETAFTTALVRETVTWLVDSGYVKMPSDKEVWVDPSILKALRKAVIRLRGLYRDIDRKSSVIVAKGVRR